MKMPGDCREKGDFNLMKKFYWTCVLICAVMMMVGGSSSSVGALGFFALAILLIVPISIKLKMGKSSQKSADAWLTERNRETRADLYDYQTNMEIYKSMMREAEILKRKANSARGYERKELLKQAERMERDAQKHYRSLI